MAVFNVSDTDTDTLSDLYAEFAEHKDTAEQLILALESDHSDPEKLNQLFRSVHTVKGNMGLMGLHPPVVLLHSLEDLLHLIRSGELEFQPIIGDITLLMLDRCDGFLSACINAGQAEYDDALNQTISDTIRQVMETGGPAGQKALETALKLLDPELAIDSHQPVSISAEDLVSQILNRNPDLAFMYNMALNSQYRCHFWEGRLQRVLNLGLNLNREMGAPVNQDQLLAAFCAHDLAMSFLPAGLLNKQTPLADTEYAIVRHHVSLGADLLSYYPSLMTAQEIILHHHEFWDGTGYPMGFSMGDIHVGARIMSVVHAFEAMTYGFSRGNQIRRPVMRAVMELNRYSGIQFDPELVNLFMKVSREQPAA